MAKDMEWSARSYCNVFPAYAKSQGSSVSVVNRQTTGVRFPAGAGIFILRHLVQTGSGGNPDSCTMGTGVSFHGGKAAGA
jgi:hypothetical protein